MDVRIHKVLDYIENNLSLKLSLNDLANIACMSPGHFHKTFKIETERTPFIFIEEIKMKKAYQVLISGSMKVHELALELGYRDYETFSRSFKKHHLLAPDDLKAISLKIHNEMEMNSEGIIIKAFEVANLKEAKVLFDQLEDKLSQLLLEKGLNEEDIENSKIMSVIPKSIETNKESELIKNKYKITKHPKIWEELLKKSKDGNT